MKKANIHKHTVHMKGDPWQNLTAVLASEEVKTLAQGALIVLGVTGLIGLTFIAPNTLRMLAPFMRKKYHRPLRTKEQKEKLMRAFYYLKESGQVKIEESENGLFVRLTRKGMQKYERSIRHVAVASHRIAWDKTWWIVAADIPTKQFPFAGDMLRIKLRALGFFHLQRTLWVYPHNPSREVEAIADQYKIGKFVTVMNVVKLDIQDKKVLLSFFTKKGIL